MSKKGKVLVAMSGGIDSTIAALMLNDEGYEVIGITMKTWDYATSATASKKETGCCNIDSFNDARLAAVEHGFPHYVLDIREEFGGAVIENFVDEYLAGRTPNPCIMCNTHIKWNALLKKADALDCEFIATGHYVQVRHEAERYVISKGVDATKDQSYVLWGLSQECLRRSIYPLGHLHKTQVRQMALDYGYPELAKKSESYEICFVPDNDYREFLKKKVTGLEDDVKGGEFVLSDGSVVGHHKGYPFYTIGQRKGLDIALGKPMYVTHIDPELNRVTLGSEEELERFDIRVSRLNMIKYDTIKPGMSALTKIRYKSAATPSTLEMSNGIVNVRFEQAVKGVAPGQSAVFYEGDDVIAGGIILA